ncbi:hypothetical protein VTN00DRAFT_6708 [Thermoascus crustaceus]|uniref:uncharacterized protein n=1 Tax=Thermoascus crustaceus TaxID=5088 RepID=UPI003742E48E
MYNLTAEMYSEWAIGLVIIAIRLYARWTTGKGSFYWDDMCLGFVVIFWTFHTVFLHLVEIYGCNIGLNHETAMQIPDSEVPRLRQGSIFAFIAWLSYIFMVWSFKGVLMFLYNRLTMGLWQHRLARIVGAICVATFMASLLFHVCICTPPSKSWQIKPYPGNNCTLRPLNYIVIETLNIATDIGVMSIPLPLVIEAKVPMTQKIILGGLFSSGILTMIAGVLRAYYSVKDIHTLATALGWASREALISVIIVSAPGIKPLLTRLGWLKSIKSSSNGYTRSSKMFSSKSGGNFAPIGNPDDYELPFYKKNKDKRNSLGESQEHIIDPTEPVPKDGPGGIMVTTEYTMAREDVPSGHASSRLPV